MADNESPERKIKDYEKIKVQLEHQIYEAATRNTCEKRKKRTRRLIVRGAILESFIPDAESYTNDEIKQLLISVFGAIPDKLREEIFRKKMTDDE